MTHSLALLPSGLLLLSSLAAQSEEATPSRAGLPGDAPTGIEWIDGPDLLKHASYLASDELGGRLTGSAGQLATARYIAERFEELGLEPLGDAEEDDQRGWYQRYPISRVSLDDAGTALVLGDQQYDQGFSVLADPANTAVDATGDLVRVERRGEVPDLEGRIPVVMLSTPKLPSKDVNLAFATAMSAFMRSRGIANRLSKKGARAVLFCVPDDESGVTTTLNYVGLAPGMAQMEFAADRGGGMAAMAQAWKAPIPQVFLSSAPTKVVKAALDSGEPLQAALQLKYLADPDAHAVNVVGCLRGSDEALASEAVIYTAHMDHVGRRMDGDVFNGADDNASGTAGLLEIAEAYARAGERPRRSIIFLSVSGEELGLWGSAWYAENPTWPLEQIVAGVNTDMIGRSGPESDVDEVTVTPSYRHPMFSTIVRDAAEIGGALGMTFSSGDKYYTRSDHYNFAVKGVPVVFFCNGEHEDYHQVTDHADKLEPEKMERIARIAYWVGRRVAQADDRPRTLGRSRDWQGTPR